jgi:hypothetical protein
MAKIKNLRDCKTPKDFKRLAKKYEREGKCEIRNGGSHMVVKVPGRGAAPLPTGNSQLGKGLISAIRRQWKLLGLAVIILGLIVNGGF